MRQQLPTCKKYVMRLWFSLVDTGVQDNRFKDRHETIKKIISLRWDQNNLLFGFPKINDDIKITTYS